MNDIDNEKIKQLNLAVELAVKNRTDFLDSKMHEYAKVKIGENMYHLETGKLLGVVDEYYRYHQDDMRFDTGLHIEYRFNNGDNTSCKSLYDFQYGTKHDLIENKKESLESLINSKG